MKLTIILAILTLIILGTGCSTVKDSSAATTNTIPSISGTQELLLNSQDLMQLGLKSNGSDCHTEEYQTSDSSSQAQFSTCAYNINGLTNTTVIIELTKFTNLNDLNGTYQYQSSHLFGAKGLLSENDFGDQSRFHVSDPSDYGGEFNKPNEYYYNLYFTKGLYMIHVTSGKDKEAKDYITRIGRLILSKFG